MEEEASFMKSLLLESLQLLDRVYNTIQWLYVFFAQLILGTICNVIVTKLVNAVAADLPKFQQLLDKLIIRYDNASRIYPR